MHTIVDDVVCVFDNHCVIMMLSSVISVGCDANIHIF